MGSMQKTTSYILLSCLSMACVTPMQAGTLLCMKVNGSVSLELGPHCCQDHHSDHSHADHSHPAGESHRDSDSDCLPGIHARCCIDLPLDHAAPELSKPSLLQKNGQGESRLMARISLVWTSPNLSSFKALSVHRTAHSPPTKTIVLLI